MSSRAYARGSVQTWLILQGIRQAKTGREKERDFKEKRMLMIHRKRKRYISKGNTVKRKGRKREE
jgi:hypothetical protein